MVIKGSGKVDPNNGENEESKPRLQIAILTDSRERIEDLPEVAGIEWLFSRKNDSTLDFYLSDSVVASINLEDPRFDLPFLIGIIGAGCDETYDELKTIFETRLSTAGVTLKRIRSWNKPAILAAALESAAESLSAQRGHSGRAALDLATYRREFERLQREFSLLERFVGSQTYRTPTEIFEYSPEIDASSGSSRKAIAVESRDPNGRKLVQSLPVDSLGLCAVWLYVNSKPDVFGERLHVTLRAIETNTVAAEWLVEPTQVQAGWVELALDRAISEFALGLELILEGPASSGEWSLGMGPPHPFEQFCVSSAEGSSLGAPLAMRLYSALPGVRISPTTTSIKPLLSSTSLSEFIPFEIFKGVTQVLPPPTETKVSLVTYDDEIGSLTVHPRSGGLTAGRINVVVPSNAWGISAHIHLANERACPTSFAMMVCPQMDERRQLARLQQLEAPSPTFSGWKILSPLDSGSISVVLPRSPEKQLTIYLLTRQGPDQNPDFGWARFSKLRFNILPKTVANQFRADSLTAMPGETAGFNEEFAVGSTAE